MLARRPKSRASVHRSGYPEDAALRAAGAGLAQAPISAPVVVGMTTTPTRIAHVEPAILSLLNQSQPCVVVLNVPDRYNERRNHWNGKRVSLPPWLAALDKAARRAGGPRGAGAGDNERCASGRERPPQVRALRFGTFYEERLRPGDEARPRSRVPDGASGQRSRGAAIARGSDRDRRQKTAEDRRGPLAGRDGGSAPRGRGRRGRRGRRGPGPRRRRRGGRRPRVGALRARARPRPRRRPRDRRGPRARRRSCPWATRRARRRARARATTRPRPSGPTTATRTRGPRPASRGRAVLRGRRADARSRGGLRWNDAGSAARSRRRRSSFAGRTATRACRRTRSASPRPATVWKSTAGLGRPHQTLKFSSSVKSKSIRLIFGRIDCSRRVLETQPKSLCRTFRIRAH